MNNALFNGLIDDSLPMLDDAGEYIPKTGIVKSTATRMTISAFIAYVDDVTMYRDTGKWAIHNLIVDGKAYVLAVEISTQLWRRINLTWDHRDACDFLTASDLWEGVQETPAPAAPNLIVKKFDQLLRDYWFHVHMDYKLTEIVDVEGERGQEITALLNNAPAGKRYANSKSAYGEKWELVDLPPAK